MAAQYGSLPFDEQLAFFRAKKLVPTDRWNDLTREQHDVGFMVAGATKADLLTDLKGAVDKAIAEGTTLAEFQKDFEAIVTKHGWTGWTGEGSAAGRAWRAKVIYQTNLHASYQAGRWAQIQAVKRDRPYLIYRHSDSVLYPRPLHVSWDGLVVEVDDPWVKTHWPPNGWGCRCRMYSLAKDDLKKYGKSGPDTPPDDGTYTWTDKKTGEMHEFPKGIDPFWDYAPGATRVGAIRETLAQKLPKLDAAVGSKMWQEIKPYLSLQNRLRWADTLDEWLSSPQSGRTSIIGAMQPEILSWLKDNKEITPSTAEVVVREGLIRGQKQARHEKAGDGLTFDEWRRLPEIVEDSDQVLFDTRTGHLIYMKSVGDDAGIKLAVRFDYLKKGNPKTNMIVSGFRQRSDIIEQMIRGGLYEVVR